jgi:hypothetical protein
MNKRRIIIFLALSFAVIGFLTTPVMAKTYSKDVKITSYGGKYIGSSNYLYANYDSKYSKTIFINIVPHYPYWSYVTKAKLKYVKKVKGKNKYLTKTYKAKIKYYRGDWISSRPKLVDSSILVRKAPKGWKPVSAKVYYKKKVYK